MNEAVGRRELLRRIGLAGVALPAVGLLGAACNGEESPSAGERIMNLTPTAGSQLTSSMPATQTAAAPAQAVDLPYLPNPEVAPPISRSEPATVQALLEVQEVEGKLADGVGYRFWTFGGTIPGPMVRARVGDHVEITIRNPADSGVGHNVDLHAVTGQGGGAELTRVNPGEEKAFRFRALNPGVYI